MKSTIGLVDDQQLFLNALSVLINTFQSFEVIIEANNGQNLVQKLRSSKIIPEIILVDVSMAVMNGPDTVKYLSDSYPDIKVVALSMKDDDAAVLSMIRAGCCAYLVKDIHPLELEKALCEIRDIGYYNGDNINYRRLLRKTNEELESAVTSKELEFLKLAGSDLTYKQIAQQMRLSERTIDGYREALFDKFKVKSRVGMVLEALRKNLITL